MTITTTRAIRALRILRDLTEDENKATKRYDEIRNYGAPGDVEEASAFELYCGSRLEGYIEGLAALLTTMGDEVSATDRTEAVMDSLRELISSTIS